MSHTRALLERAPLDACINENGDIAVRWLGWWGAGDTMGEAMEAVLRKWKKAGCKAHPEFVAVVEESLRVPAVPRAANDAAGAEVPAGASGLGDPDRSSGAPDADVTDVPEINPGSPRRGQSDLDDAGAGAAYGRALPANRDAGAPFGLDALGRLVVDALNQWTPPRHAAEIGADAQEVRLLITNSDAGALPEGATERVEPVAWDCERDDKDFGRVLSGAGPWRHKWQAQEWAQQFANLKPSIFPLYRQPVVQRVKIDAIVEEIAPEIPTGWRNEKVEGAAWERKKERNRLRAILSRHLGGGEGAT